MWSCITETVQLFYKIFSLLLCSSSRYKSSRKRKRGVDYNDEIPFEKQPPLGFYDTSADIPEVERPNFKRMKQEDVLGLKRDEYERVSGTLRLVCMF